MARRSAGGGHGKGANRVLNRRHSTRHGARGAAPRCEGHERHHGVKATVEITHGWKTRCNAVAAHRLPWLRVFRYQHFATNRSRIPLRFPHLSQRISEVLNFFEVLSNFSKWHFATNRPTPQRNCSCCALYLPASASVRRFSLLWTTTRFYTALYYPPHPAVPSKHGRRSDQSADYQGALTQRLRPLCWVQCLSLADHEQSFATDCKCNCQ